MRGVHSLAPVSGKCCSAHRASGDIPWADRRAGGKSPNLLQLAGAKQRQCCVINWLYGRGPPEMPDNFHRVPLNRATIAGWERALVAINGGSSNEVPFSLLTSRLHMEVIASRTGGQMNCCPWQEIWGLP